MNTLSIWVDEGESIDVREFMRQRVEEQERRLHDMFIVALCGPMGRVRREMRVRRGTGELIGLAEEYP